jgi:hypothetical protein
MRSVLGRSVLFVLFLCATASAALAQDGSNQTRVWGALGIGAGVPTSGGDGIANMAELVIQKRPHHFAIRGLVLHDLARATETIGEVSAVYGRTNLLPSTNVALAIGVSGVAFDTCPDDDDSCFTVGLPIVAEFSRSRQFIGLGIQLFGNLNAKASYAGAVVFLQLGQLR